MQAKVVSELVLFGKIIGSISVIIGGLWVLFNPIVDNYINKKIEEYNKTINYEVRHKELVQNYLNSAEFDKFYAQVVEKRNSNFVSLRELLGLKMDVPYDEVHIHLGTLYKKEKKLIERVDRMEARINEINILLSSFPTSPVIN